jgi:hypothetical protein
MVLKHILEKSEILWSHAFLIELIVEAELESVFSCGWIYSEHLVVVLEHINYLLSLLHFFILLPLRRELV